MNIHVQVFLWTCTPIFSWYVPKSGIAGSFDSYMCSCSGRCLLLVLAETDKIFRRVFTELCGWKLARLVVDIET